MTNPSGVVAMRALFALAGLAAGLLTGWLAYDRTESVVLAVFAGLLAMNYIGRGIGDVITDPQKGRRFVFFTLPLVFAVGGLAVGYTIWAAWWVASVVGFVLYIVGSVVATVLFPRIAAEEAEDTQVRMGRTSQPSAPDESLNKVPSPYDNLKGF